MSVNIIRHDGVVQEISERVVLVRITQQPACAACRAASHCHAAENKEKIITVHGSYPHLQVGDKVTVTAPSSQGHKAVMWAFSLPLLLLLAVLVVAIAAGASELLAVILAIATIAIYYLALYMLRKRISPTFSFEILGMPRIT